MPASEPVPQAESTTSPKVPAAAKGSGWTGLGIAVLSAVVISVSTTITPETLSPVLGPLWAIPAVSLVQAAASAYAAWKNGYRVADPLRDMTPIITPVVYRDNTGPDGVAADVTAPAIEVPDGTGPDGVAADVTAPAIEVPDGTGA